MYIFSLLGRKGLRDEMLASNCPVSAVTKGFKLCEANGVGPETVVDFEDDFSVVRPLPGKAPAH